MNSNSTPDMAAINDNASFVPDSRDRLKPVRIWLYIIALMVLAMVVVGGATRLTHSGLSITSWQPISGIIPPLSDADWAVEFNGYKQIPEFQQLNSWMTLQDFKGIFWWEWSHRFLGRIIGFAFFVPFLVFLFQRRLSWRLAPSLLVLFLLGGFQGFLGWWMVSSGLSDRTDVSQYRLAAHLGAACILFLALIVVARRLRPVEKAAEPTSRGWFWAVVCFGVLVYVQLLAGALVAGLDAGFGFNTWPLMEGAWVPPGLTSMSPLWHNFFENLLTVQFQHRCIAYLVAIFAVVLLVIAGRKQMVTGVHAWMPRITLVVFVQIVLGILTLLFVVPLPLALLHQAMAFILLGCIAAYAADMSKRLW